MGLGQQGSEALGPGSNLRRVRYFLISLWHLSEFAIVPMAQWVGQQTSEAVGPGSIPCRVIYFYDFTDICQNFRWFLGTVGRITGFWSGRYIFESQLLPTFFNLNITTKNRNIPLLCVKFFDTRKILNHRRVSPRFFSVLWDKKISTKNRDMPLLCMKFFDTRN